jgi:hypothetical protein
MKQNRTERANDRCEERAKYFVDFKTKGLMYKIKVSGDEGRNRNLRGLFGDSQQRDSIVATIHSIDEREKESKRTQLTPFFRAPFFPCGGRPNRSLPPTYKSRLELSHRDPFGFRRIPW